MNFKDEMIIYVYLSFFFKTRETGSKYLSRKEEKKTHLKHWVGYEFND